MQALISFHLWDVELLAYYIELSQIILCIQDNIRVDIVIRKALDKSIAGWQLTKPSYHESCSLLSSGSRMDTKSVWNLSSLNVAAFLQAPNT